MTTTPDFGPPRVREDFGPPRVREVHRPLVRRPSLWTCCSAIATAPLGLVRPRRADRDFLDQLVDAGLPLARQTAKIVALQQVPKWVPTAGIVEGVRSPRRVAIAMTAFVVEHPRARFVVDPGMCADVGRRVISQLPRVLRAAVRPPADAIPTAVALGERTVDFALPTHLHWDHVCGLLDLPSMPVHVHQPELEWVNTGVLAPVGGVRDALRDRPISTYALDGPPVATFERSHDLFGDGSVVLVDLAGHTHPRQCGGPRRHGFGLGAAGRRCGLAQPPGRGYSAKVELPRRVRRRGPRRLLSQCAPTARGEGPDAHRPHP